jgi:hypothetical protein
MNRTSKPGATSFTAYGLRTLTSPALRVAKFVLTLAVFFGEIAAVITCGLRTQDSQCNSLGSGMCGYVLMGTLLSMATIIVVLLPEDIISMIVRTRIHTKATTNCCGLTNLTAVSYGNPKPSSKTVLSLKRLKYSVVFGCVLLAFILAGHVTLICGSMLFNSSPSVCEPDPVKIVFEISCALRLFSALSVLLVWVWWLVKITKTINALPAGLTELDSDSRLL